MSLPQLPPSSSETSTEILAKAREKSSHNTFGIFLHLGGYVLIAGLAHLGSYSRHIKERERRHANLSRELTEARLAGLHSQLHPHFLFNALNIIASEVHEKPDDAAEMIVHLSDLLRSSLTLDSSNHLIPLHQELKMLDDYLAIQARRFGERLTIRREFDSETLDLSVPPFLLQPIVENALQHGLEPLARPGTLTLSARRHGDDITLTIEDDGVGLDPPPQRPNAAARAAPASASPTSAAASRLSSLRNFPSRLRPPLRQAAPASPSPCPSPPWKIHDPHPHRRRRSACAHPQRLRDRHRMQ